MALHLTNCRFKFVWLVAFAFIACISTKLFAEEAEEQGTTIIGTKEAPNVLNVVPWQERELQVDLWDATPNLDSQLLDESLQPVDKNELQRQIQYHDTLFRSSNVTE